MEIKRRNSALDDAESSNEIEYDSEKQQRKKRKITKDDVASKVEKKMIKSRNANTSSHLPLKIMYSGKEEREKQRESTKESETNFVDGTNICEKFVYGKKIEGGVIGVRPTNTKNSHLPLEVMCSVKEEKSKEIERMEEIGSNRVDGTDSSEKFVREKKTECGIIGSSPTYMKYSHLPLEIKYSVIEEKRREIERKREILKVRSTEEKMIKKREHEERMAFWARVRGQQRPAEFLGDPRGLQSTTVADVKNILQGKSHNELELLQSEVQLQMCFSSANDVEYWETVLDIHAKIFGKFYGQKLINLCNAGSDGKYDQVGTGIAEGTGSSCSPELLHGEETGDNFEIMTMGIMEDGDALSGNNDEVICQSQVCWSQNKCRPKKSKCFDQVHNEYGRNNQTH